MIGEKCAAMIRADHLAEPAPRRNIAA